MFIWDIVRPKGEAEAAKRNPWGAGAVEWMLDMPPRDWGARTVPRVTSRYPLWDDPDFLRKYDEGRFYLPDAEEGRREAIVTSVLDAEPIQVLRVAGPTSITIWAACTLGAAFIFATFHWWWLTGLGAVAALVSIVWWHWTGTSEHPEKPEKDIGLGVSVPLYISGPRSTGWWAMFITMTGDLTAFLGLVFGLFFFWTVHPEFPPAGAPIPGLGWPLAAGALLLAAWGLTWGGRAVNRRGGVGAFRAMLVGAVLCACGGVAALCAGPWTAGMDPTAHSWPAIVWALVLWTGRACGRGRGDAALLPRGQPLGPADAAP